MVGRQDLRAAKVSGQYPARSGPDWRLVAAALALAVVILVARTLVGRAGEPFFSDTDDAMRMVVVRDFLAGQGWYDLGAHRLNTPFGGDIHWSRLVDVPLALLVAGFSLFLAPDVALVAAGTVWPMLLLGVLLWVSARLALVLIGPEGVLPGLILPILSPAVTAEFSPGRVDHHNVVILLTLAMAWTAVEAVKRPRYAIWCGFFAATALAIATESLPAIAAAILAMGLLYVFDATKAATMRAFGLAFAVGSAVHLALYRPPAQWLEAACDALSPVYVAVALLVGAAFTLVSFMPPPQRPVMRFALLGGLGLVSMGIVALLYPQCLRGPYGELDPWLQTHWLAAIVEAKPWFESVRELPAYGVAVGLPVLLAGLVMLWRLWRVREGRAEWGVLLVFLVCTALTMLVQVRGARLAIMVAIPAAAWLIIVARRRYLARASFVTVSGLVGSWLIFSGVVLSLLVSGLQNLTQMEARGDAVLAAAAPAEADKNACLMPAAFADLAALPPEAIMAPIDLGAHLLLYTPHAVVAAPYHRNQSAVLDTFRFFNAPIAEARKILEARHITLVVTCPAMPELRGLSDAAEDSLVKDFAAGRLPPWLVDMSLPDSPLRIYAVVPG